jgi:hypothetical protein
MRQASPTPLSPALIATLDRPFPEIASTFDWHIPLLYRADTVRDSSRLCPSWWNHCVSGEWLEIQSGAAAPQSKTRIGYLLFKKNS